MMDPVYVDFEASAGRTGYPIEIGWAWQQGDTRIATASFLIGPSAAWSREGMWDPAAEALHGLSRRQLEAEGLDPGIVAAQVMTALANRKVCFDTGPKGWDRSWWRQLFRAVGHEDDAEAFAFTRAAPEMLMDMAAQLGVSENVWTILERVAPPKPHRAAADAAYWAWWQVSLRLVHRAGLGALPGLGEGFDAVRQCVSEIRIDGSESQHGKPRIDPAEGNSQP